MQTNKAKNEYALYTLFICYYDKQNAIYTIYMISTVPNVHRWWLGEFRDDEIFNLCPRKWPTFIQ